MGARKDPVRIVIRVVVFIVVFYGMGFVLDPLLRWTFQDFAGPTFAVFISGLFTTWLSLRIYENIAIVDVGLWWNGSSARNLGLGLAGGAGAACMAMIPALLVGAAKLTRVGPVNWSGLAFILVCIAAGSVGEEIFFRGYGFQVLVDGLGPWSATLPIGIFFGVMHASNPGATTFGIVNTAGFGVLFGYSYLRSRDLWLPIGLHFGWNVTLPLLGANLSGIKIFKEITGHEMVWRAGAFWSGGDYGPEASILTSLALVPLAIYIWKAPISRQRSPITDPPAESALCEPSPQLPS